MTPTNDNNGFIVLHRSILSWEWYDDVNTTRVFIHCLLRANHTPRKWHGHLIGRGQFITSLAKLAKETRLSVRELRTALNHLIATHELTSETTKQFSIITITNYALYQDQKNTTDTLNDTLNDTQATNDRQTTDKRPTTNNNNNNEINIIDDDNNTRARENFSEKKIDVIYKELKQQYSEESATTNALRLKVYREYNKNLTTQQIGTYFDEFYETQLAAGLNTANRKDYMIHFANWLYKRIEIDNESNKNKKNRNNGTKRPETLAGADEFSERV